MSQQVVTDDYNARSSRICDVWMEQRRHRDEDLGAYVECAPSSALNMGPSPPALIPFIRQIQDLFAVTQVGALHKHERNERQISRAAVCDGRLVTSKSIALTISEREK